ncbi:hypothetical protein EG328_002362 [Venturia inaequalis]|uniref:Uncharacterized protein n=1 Tax=Venturia inaequalis TaxID=5025 RepID=A0A8H3Z133_VENIN|nr:hypothetical protein EG328_002362 [Venturia inaequalis]RDI82750.1 NADH-cytochrome b5 reductase 2 [Venturia inaequalis]
MIISITLFQTLYLITSSARLIHAQDDRPRDLLNSFNFPWTAQIDVKHDRSIWSGNSIYPLGSQIPLAWVTNFTSASLALIQDGTYQAWDVAVFTSTDRQFTWNAQLPREASFSTEKNNVFYFVMASLKGQYFFSRYFNLTDDPKWTSALTSGLSSVTSASMVTRSMTAKGVQVAKTPSSSSAPLPTTELLTMVTEDTPSSLSASSVVTSSLGGAWASLMDEPMPTSSSATTILEPKPASTLASAFPSTLVSTKLFDTSTNSVPTATSSPNPSTAIRNNMKIYGGAIGGGIGCAALMFVVAYLVTRYKTKQRLKKAYSSSITKPNIDERKPGCRCAPSYKMDSPTLPDITRPDTSTSIGTSILFPEYSADEGARSFRNFSD